jgi:hypothetical protein
VCAKLAVPGSAHRSLKTGKFKIVRKKLRPNQPTHNDDEQSFPPRSRLTLLQKSLQPVHRQNKEQKYKKQSTTPKETPANKQNQILNPAPNSKRIWESQTYSPSKTKSCKKSNSVDRMQNKNERPSDEHTTSLQGRCRSRSREL